MGDSRPRSIGLATASDVDAIIYLILEHGPNSWNYLPEDEVRAHVKGIRDGRVKAVVARDGDAIIGVVTYEVGKGHAKYQPQGRAGEDHGYIAEAVVHRDWVGRGIGSGLLSAAIRELQASDIHEIYAMRHADNAASGGMMAKSGMVIIDEFDDPDRRPSGSRRTVVMRVVV